MSVHYQWVCTAGHQSASIHEAMTNLTSLKLSSSNQHVEMSNSRKACDQDDAEKIFKWLKDHNPFKRDDQKFKSLSSRNRAADDSPINCDRAGAVWEHKPE